MDKSGILNNLNNMNGTQLSTSPNNVPEVLEKILAYMSDNDMSTNKQQMLSFSRGYYRDTYNSIEPQRVRDETQLARVVTSLLPCQKLLKTKVGTFRQFYDYFGPLSKQLPDLVETAQRFAEENPHSPVAPYFRIITREFVCLPLVNGVVPRIEEYLEQVQRNKRPRDTTKLDTDTSIVHFLTKSAIERLSQMFLTLGQLLSDRNSYAIYMHNLPCWEDMVEQNTPASPTEDQLENLSKRLAKIM